MKKLLVANTLTTLLCVLISLIIYRFADHRPNPVLFANFAVGFIGMFVAASWSHASALVTASVPPVFMGAEMTWIFQDSPTLFDLQFINALALLIVAYLSWLATSVARKEGAREPLWALFTGAFPVLGIVIGWPLYFLKFRHSNLATA